MNKPLVLGASEARAMAFRASFGYPLAGFGSEAHKSRPASVVDRAAAALERIGHVQIDTISVVERAHHHILWSRDREYRPSVLPALEAPPRRAFEYWAHAAAYLPLSDYRYCLPRMRRIAAEGHEWFPTDPRVADWVRDRIRAEGPLRSQDFQSEGGRGPWWDWKPAKAALEYLFQSGELLVAGRQGFQKIYDLAERVLPPEVDTSFPSEAEMGDWFVRRAASALGVFKLRDLSYQRRDGTKGITQALERACEEGLLRPCLIREDGAGMEASMETGIEARIATIPDPGFARAPEDQNRQAEKSWCDSGKLNLVAGRGRLARILSPFDNLIINRRRASRIFGLEYTIECYVPAAKRKFGYFALPVFFQDKPVGLVDCKADRKSRILVVNRMGFDWGTEPSEGPEGFADSFEEELSAFASFNACLTWRRKPDPA